MAFRPSPSSQPRIAAGSFGVTFGCKRRFAGPPTALKPNGRARKMSPPMPDHCVQILQTRRLSDQETTSTVS